MAKKTDDQMLADVAETLYQYNQEILTAEEAIGLIRRFTDPEDEMTDVSKQQ